MPMPDGNRALAPGLLLLALWLVAQLSGWRWPWLDALQADDGYKQLSGAALVAFVIHQWRLPLLRLRGAMDDAVRRLDDHKWAGVLAPVLFWLHAQALGYAYLLALSLTFWAVVAGGFVNSRIARVRTPALRWLWITGHIALASALPLLIGFHVWTSYLYE